MSFFTSSIFMLFRSIHVENARIFVVALLIRWVALGKEAGNRVLDNSNASFSLSFELYSLLTDSESVCLVSRSSAPIARQIFSRVSVFNLLIDFQFNKKKLNKVEDE